MTTAWATHPLRLGVFFASLGLAVTTFGCATPASTSGSSARRSESPGAPAPPSVDAPCPLLPCSDHLAVSLHLAPEDAARGLHRFELTIDGRTESCELDVVQVGAMVEATCGRGIRVRLGATMRGVEVPSPVPGTVMHGEEPVAGAFQADFEFYGTPRSVRIVHRAAGRPVFERTLTPTYEAIRPNGPRCDPVCQAAVIDLP